MLLTEIYLKRLLNSRRRELEDDVAFLSCDGDLNQKEIDAEIKEIRAIRRVLDGKESIKLSGDSVWLYFSNILKIG